MSIQDEYKHFIEECTKSGKSYKNYSDFKRINETVAKIKKIALFDIYSVTDPVIMQSIINDLSKNIDYQTYNKTGKNQYSEALIWYLNFLNAKQLFTVISPQMSLPKKQINKLPKQLHLQQIFYGAPGTGKSHKVKEITDSYGKDHTVRITFHPDSDYASFIGVYKPTMKIVDVFDKSTGKKTGFEERIIYSFVPQSFLKAYIAAWQQLSNKEAEYLVIEEINRGNCAQIFGDLFQLLDRNDEGFSEYPILADDDVKQFLAKEFASIDGEQKDEIDNISDKILTGELLMLPDNLHIIATMNTSDQSLFPIDSAFKRRWDWKYIPISDAGKHWLIEVDGNRYDWWSFLETINKKVEDATNSEDKKLGYFFAKADDKGIISADTFVDKVLFYLWNDVFKDYGFDDAIFADNDESQLSFGKFFMPNGNINEANVNKFLENLGLEKTFNYEQQDASQTASDVYTEKA